MKYPVSIVHWIPCSEKLPDEPLPGAEQRYLVALREHYGLNKDGSRRPYSNEETWCYYTDFAYYSPGHGYIGDWTTENDWDEGQRVEITHWAELPDYPDIDTY